MNVNICPGKILIYKSMENHRIIIKIKSLIKIFTVHEAIFVGTLKDHFYWVLEMDFDITTT